jgi:hypothetical protein
MYCNLVTSRLMNLSLMRDGVNMMGTEIAKWLEEVGMKPSELADELGLPRGQVSRLIVGEEEPDRLTEWAMAGLRAARQQASKGKTRRATEVRTPKAALAEELQDDSWSGQAARLALPVLIDIARSGKPSTITYTELHEKVVDRGGQANVGKMTKYAFPLGRIATAMERLEVPPLTSIVVRGATGLPSSGINAFIVQHLGLDGASAKALEVSTSAVRRKIVGQLWDEVFSYRKWPDVMADLGITGDPAYDK